MTGTVQVAYFITHPDVLIDPAVPVPDWKLAPCGRARMVRASASSWMAGVRSIWCSAERKSRDAASILGEQLGLSVAGLVGLGENDRSATGYLPAAEFESVADRFFAQPEQSVRGWERAIDAQRRIVTAVDHVCAAAAGCGGDLAIVSHGGVGTLLLCHLRGEAISRAHDQPRNNGGNYFAFDIATRRLRHGWRAIDES
jgi:broad specificity phosphatase PhoE